MIPFDDELDNCFSCGYDLSGTGIFCQQCILSDTFELESWFAIIVLSGMRRATHEEIMSL